MTIQELFDRAIKIAIDRLDSKFELGFGSNSSYAQTEFKLLMEGNYFGCFSIKNAEDCFKPHSEMIEELANMINLLIMNCLRNGQLLQKEDKLKINHTKLLEN